MSGTPPSSNSNNVDNHVAHTIKVLLVGDSSVGKSSLLLRFTSDTFEDLTPTVGVDFRLRFMNVHNKRIKLTVWDTAGQERFRTLTSSYYRGAQGVVLVYDVSQRSTFENLRDVWLREVEMYVTVPDAVRMIVGNKVDLDAEHGGKETARQVSREEGAAFARANGCLFVETSAKTREGVMQCFDELVQKIMDTPQLLFEQGGRVAVGAGRAGGARTQSTCC
ncbi:Ras-related protein Rab [Pseudoscourfieldia marina]